jgi:hypothetical protein
VVNLGAILTVVLSMAIPVAGLGGVALFVVRRKFADVLLSTSRLLVGLSLHQFVGWFLGRIPLDHSSPANLTIGAAAISNTQWPIADEVLRSAVPAGEATSEFTSRISGAE